MVVECGGGLAIPSVRVQGEAGLTNLSRKLMNRAPDKQLSGCGGWRGQRIRLIRINPVHCKVSRRPFRGPDDTTARAGAADEWNRHSNGQHARPGCVYRLETPLKDKLREFTETAWHAGAGLKLLDAALMKPKAKCKKDVKVPLRNSHTLAQNILRSYRGGSRPEAISRAAKSQVKAA